MGPLFNGSSGLGTSGGDAKFRTGQNLIPSLDAAIASPNAPGTSPRFSQTPGDRMDEGKRNRTRCNRGAIALLMNP
ncbi:hypothetical protein J0895_20810 [Phormidium pseudopriestleyi FRX01]|uniref:Uncharacterized protein n=1 Tax=Phormidium pseudopriestleyi FRX01 TaxID=1759528 RepID=A0ABS3FWW3_9CYAN|nr:hypothetical protein [Phormidium pseudopriestleyi FRX01]